MSRFFVLLVAVAALVATVSAHDEYIEGEILVGWKRGGVKVARDLNARSSVHARFGGSHIVAKSTPSLDIDFIKFETHAKAEEAMKLYEAHPDVEYAELNYIYHAMSAPNDPRYNRLWAFGSNFWSMPEVWAAYNKGAGVTVAVLDTGIDFQHPDLTNVDTGRSRDFTGTGSADDDHYHGTHCAGTVGAVGDNNEGVIGVAPECSMIAIKVLGGDGSGSNGGITQGIEYGATVADILSLSLGGPGFSSSMDRAVNNAVNAGVFLVCAMGNDGPSTQTSYPAGYDGCFAVANYKSDRQIAPSSTRGPHCDAAGPGTDIHSTIPTDVRSNTGQIVTPPYYDLTGTSMATPFVSGVAALLKSQNSALSPAELGNILRTTASKWNGQTTKDSVFGHGAVNPMAALNAVGGGNNPNPPPPNPPPPPSSNPVYTNGPDFDGSFSGFTNLDSINTQDSSDSKSGNSISFDSDRVVAYLSITSSAQSVAFSPSVQESLTFSMKAVGFTGSRRLAYVAAVDDGQQVTGQIISLDSYLTGAWSDVTVSMSDLCGNDVPSAILFMFFGQPTVYLDDIAINARAVPAGQATYKRPPNVELTSSTPSGNVTLYPWQFSVTGGEAFTLTVDPPGSIRGERLVTDYYEAEVVRSAGGTFTTFNIELAYNGDGKLTGYSPSTWGAPGTFNMRLQKNGVPFSADSEVMSVEAYDCVNDSGSETCDTCITIGPQCVWCQGSCHDIRASECTLEEKDEPCPVIGSEVSISSTLLAGYGLLVAILALC